MRRGVNVHCSDVPVLQYHGLLDPELVPVPFCLMPCGFVDGGGVTGSVQEVVSGCEPGGQQRERSELIFPEASVI